jgi:hypothetical protein
MSLTDTEGSGLYSGFLADVPARLSAGATVFLRGGHSMISE